MDDIRENFLTIVTTSQFASVCTDNPDCTVENVDVTCGPVSQTRKRRELASSVQVPAWLLAKRQSNTYPMNKDENMTGWRGKRSTPDHTHQVKVSFDLSIGIQYGDGAVDVNSLYTELLNQVMDMADVVEQEVEAGQFEMVVQGLSIECDRTSFSYGYETLECSEGMVEEWTTFSCSKLDNWLANLKVKKGISSITLS